MRHGSLIWGKAGSFAPIWSKFGCTGTSTLCQQMLRLCHKSPDTGTHYRLDCLYAKWDRQIRSDQWVIMICALDSTVHRRIQGISSWLIKHSVFANLICQLNQTRQYWVPVSGVSWHSRRICWPKVEVPVHRRILGISSWQIQHCIFANPICQSKQTRRYWVLVSKYETSVHLFVANPQLLQAYHWTLAHLWSASERVGSWDKARVFLTQMPLSLPGFSRLWLKIIHNWDLQSCPEWASCICMKPTLTSCEWLSMLSFQLRQASRATNKLPKRMSLQYVVHFVHFSLLHSHHVFFDFELVDPVHTDRPWHFTFRCRWLIPLRAC